MRLLYTFPEPLPLERARGLQVVQTVAALGRAGVDVTLAFAPVRGPGGAFGAHVDPFAHYAIARPAGVTLAAVPRSLPWPFSGVHSNRLYFANLQRNCAKGLAAGPVFVRHLKLAANIARRLPEACFVYEAHEVFGDTATPARREENRVLERTVIAAAGAVIANSAATARRLEALYGGPALLAVVPNGVARPDALPDKPWADAARHIVYAGSFFPWKGVGELVDAAARLPGCHIALIGGEPQRIAEMEASCSPDGAVIEFAGRLPHTAVMARLAGACIAVLPNREDTDSAFTSPIKLFEYMAAGCAIVASDLPALREVLGENEAVWVKPGDAAALAAGIQALASDPQRARALGERVRLRSGEFTWDARGSRVKAVLEDMLRMKARQ